MEMHGFCYDQESHGAKEQAEIKKETCSEENTKEERSKEESVKDEINLNQETWFKQTTSFNKTSSKEAITVNKDNNRKETNKVGIRGYVGNAVLVLCVTSWL